MLKLTLLTAAAMAAISTSAQATATLVATQTGNACTGKGGINVCYATQTGPSKTDTTGSPLIARIDGSNVDVSSLFSTIDGNEFDVTYTAADNTLSFTYAPGPGDPTIHYFGIFQADTYDLFYDSNPITSGSINLSSYFPNNPGWSHIDFFDTGTTTPPPALPEPGTWVMMLAGFGVVGFAARRKRVKRSLA